MVDFSLCPDINFVVTIFQGSTKDYLCGVSEYFNFYWKWYHHQLVFFMEIPPRPHRPCVGLNLTNFRKALDEVMGLYDLVSIRQCVNTLRPRQHGHHFADDIFKCMSINISLRFVSKGQINNITKLVQVMAWRHPGDKPLSEPMMVKFTDAYKHHSASMS